MAPAKHNGNKKVKVVNSWEPWWTKESGRSRKELRGIASALEKAKKAGEDTLERQEEYKRASHAFRKQVRKDKQVHADTLNKSLAELSSDPILPKDF